ncbi:hypothetical protein G3T20_17805 [Bordetella hinzii]|uniref:hypothetical protein n=1 Tax=Bordetella hinzii TaxID=103855 RepID=UPI0013EFE2D3|nr:hypothetical protein [Bordetella hinzii]QII86377.1 hypothetical protein G3T20_17805 [Bordetella hinzii]
MITVEPGGAFNSMVLATPVSILTPTLAIKVPAGVPTGKKKLPLASVRTPVLKSASPSPLVSTQICAPRT